MAACSLFAAASQLSSSNFVARRRDIDSLYCNERKCARIHTQDPDLGFLFNVFYKFAGGAGSTDETGTNKDTHQLPVISMGTLIEAPAHYVNFVMGNG